MRLDSGTAGRWWLGLWRRRERPHQIKARASMATRWQEGEVEVEGEERGRRKQ